MSRSPAGSLKQCPQKGPAQNSVAGTALMQQPSSAFRARLAVDPRFRPTSPNAILLIPLRRPRLKRVAAEGTKHPRSV